MSISNAATFYLPHAAAVPDDGWKSSENSKNKKIRYTTQMVEQMKIGKLGNWKFANNRKNNKESSAKLYLIYSKCKRFYDQITTTQQLPSIFCEIFSILSL